MTIEKSQPGPSRRKWLKRGAAVIVVLLVVAYWANYDVLRTLRSLKRVEGTNAYVMDYYCDYHMDAIRASGVDTKDVEGSFIDTFFSTPIAFVARGVQSWFVPKKLELPDGNQHHCSTLALKTADGTTYFGRNFDWHHNAALILRVHRAGRVESVSVIDLAYLNLDRPDLDKSSLLVRIPLLFAPYYVMDGANRSGLAISDMSVDEAQPPYDSAKPDVPHATAMRLVLDYCATTDEAVEMLAEYNISFGGPCHLMIADSSGDSAVIEYTRGETRIIRSHQTWQACTNFRLADLAESERIESCDRYRQASQQMQSLNGQANENAVMKIMDSIAVQDWTMWSSVYNLSDDELYFVHRKSNGDETPVRILFSN